MFQTITIAGNLTRDPETTQQGESKMSRFAVAVNKTVKGEQRTTYFDVVAWANQADLAEKYLKKGSGVFIRGEMSRREVEKEGAKKIYWDLNAQEIRFIPGTGPKSAAPAPASAPAPDNGRDDIPF